MKYYNLYIDFEPSWNTYNKITDILNLKPFKHAKSKFDKNDAPSTWHYQLVENEVDQPIDFINYFLDILDPNFSKLKLLGIGKSNILFWLVYEYQHQCSMEFHAQEMNRLGKTGIGLNIDCAERLNKS